VFENAKRIYREIRILRLMAHPNVVRIVHVQQP
jgi:serine/threonine protein kinase